MRRLSTVLLCLIFPLMAWTYPLVPIDGMTPGEVCDVDNPDFERFRYEERIPYCKRNVSKSQKTRIYEAYNIPEECRGRYTIDHLIPLSIGGTNSELNLWPEHVLIKAERPDLEHDTFKLLAAGEITQEEAIETILEAKRNFSERLLRDDHAYCNL